MNDVGIRFLLTSDRFDVAIPVTSTGPSTVAARLRLEILEPDDRIASSEEREIRLAPGRRVISMSLPAPDSARGDALLWFRLRYRLALDRASEPLAHGTIALGGAADVFSLTTACRRWLLIPGQPYAVRVRAANPVTRQPVSGVTVRGTLELANGQKYPAQGAPTATGPGGEVVLRWRVPPSAPSGDATLRLEARKGTVVRQQAIGVQSNRGERIVVSTDKPLYQPGQALHARALVVSHARRAVARASARFTLRDPDNNVLLRAETTTNQFGIASVDWQLPASLRQGRHRLEVQRLEADGRDAANGMSTIDVRRYDLPTFTVAAVADRPYYLPGQDCQIDVASTYLFGKPVAHGTVRLVREEDRHWNHREQKWESREEESQSGQLDARGHVVFHVDPAAAHSDVKGDTYPRYTDLTYAAFVTDATTGRTEERRLRVRVSRDPIHLYLFGTTRVGDDLANFYVTACYPDGAPARVDVRVGLPANQGVYRAVGTVTTNRYGVAKLSGIRIPGADADDETTIVLDARAKDGRAVHYEQSVWWDRRNVLLSTDKTLYRAGEPIRVSIRGATTGSVVLDAMSNDAVVWSTRVPLRHGTGFSVVPFRAEFQGEIRLVAYSLDVPGDDRELRFAGTRGVLYPHDTTLRVDVRTDRRTYMPGEPVVAALRVRSPSGSRASAIGVVVADRAVEERARTDDEFGTRYSGFWDWSWWDEPLAVGGVSLNGLDLSRELPAGLDLAAEVLLNAWSRGILPEVEADDYVKVTERHFRPAILARLGTVRAALERSATFPANDDELGEVMRNAGLPAGSLTDPWNSRYTVRYDVEGPERTLEVISPGPDKVAGTADDIAALSLRRNYFTAAGQLMDAAAKEMFARTGQCIHDEAVLRRELLGHGLDISSLRDPRGAPYVFSFPAEGRWCRVLVHTAGSAMTPRRWPSVWDYRPVWTTSIDYFQEGRRRLDAAAAALERLPGNDEEMDRMLDRAGLDLHAMRDPWGSAYYVTYERTQDYGQVFVYSSDRAGEQMTPVTRAFRLVKVRSPGPDRMRGTRDDVEVAGMSQLVDEQSGLNPTPQSKSAVPLSAGTGAIEGVVKDTSGAAVPGAKVLVTAEEGTATYSGVTAADGRYLVRDIDPGSYRVEASLSGFTTVWVQHVPVTAAAATTVNITLSVGAQEELVTVSGEATTLQTRPATGNLRQFVEPGQPRPAGRSGPISTPPLRDYFPETLYWAPSIITDRFGATKVRFDLADNITTWKMQVVASNVEGEIGTAEAEIVAFQPFFVEHDPPKVLTVGDRIDLPVVLRSYLSQPQRVHVEMTPADWFTLRGQARQTVAVAAGDAERVVFPMTAVSAVERGAQQVSATSAAAGDRIEKTVYVHPDGEERTLTSARFLRGSASVPIELPAEMGGQTVGSTLKIYPNLLAHVVESMEAGMRRPYGCAEQAISAAYPAVLLLKHANAGALPPATKLAAERHAREGLERLLANRSPSGGFSYWGRDDADVALTAYAVRFIADLSDVPQLVSVDTAVVESALGWLTARQRADGRWQPRYGGDEALTAYVTYTLAHTANRARTDKRKRSVAEAVQRGLRALDSPREPYALALLALAASDAGNPDAAAQAIAKLRSMAHREGTGVYWALETNTPFYGWGRAGRVETTALVVKALSTVRGSSREPDDLVDAGLLFLLGQKDAFGVWYSGQATVNVDDALLGATRPGDARGGSKVRVIVNGQRGPDVDIPASSFPAAPVLADISRWMKPGANTVELAQPDTASDASVQIVSTYFVPWEKQADAREQLLPGESRALRLAVDFDRPSAEVGDEVKCTVQVERIGHVGYGMMLAEVGLPPGADVDRASLDKAVETSGWRVSRYEVQPDRVIFYVWPSAGGSTFTFAVRPRFAMKARSASSTLYDYYNPDARVTVAPADFDVRSR